MRIIPKIFETAIANEIQLVADAKKLLKNFTSMPPNAEDILKLSQQHSTDIAARTFYEGLLQSKHRLFIQKLQNYKKQSINQTTDIKILLIPGMFYKEHPETGADGSLVREIAEQSGFKVELIETESGGSVSINSAIIKKKLETEIHPDIWLVSVSKGAGDIRHYLQNCPINTNIKGWVNVAGISKGMPYIDYRLNNPLKRLFVRLLCLVYPLKYQALVELQTHHPFWNNSSWPDTIEMIHIIPIPHSAHIQNQLRTKYRKTLKRGPNDGFTLITDVLDLPGHIFPVWGCDHFMRTAGLSGILYQLFNYLSDQNQGDTNAQL